MELVVIGALLIGLSLGLFGSGGSILTVPVLVYLLHHAEKVAIAESLGIVGGIALVSLIPYWRARQINWRLVVLFGIPGMIGTYLGAWLAGFVSGAFQLLLFAVVMLAAAVSMLRRKRKQQPVPAAAPLHPGTTEACDDKTAASDAPSEEPARAEESAPAEQPEAREAAEPAQPQVKSKPLVVGEGLGVGAITGLVGVGGGFLIVPALVLLAKQAMRVAIGTSLAIIFLKSISGFGKYLYSLGEMGLSVNWATIGWFILLGAVGSFAGSALSARIRQESLQRGFAIFLVIMGLIILGNQLFVLLGS